MKSPNSVDLKRATTCAWAYRTLGFNPLPSRSDEKAPWLKRYHHLHGELLPHEALDQWWAANIQIPTGKRWGLVVVDCDGPEAIAEHNRWLSEHGWHETWVVRSGGGGLHFWYSCSHELEIPYRVVWAQWDYLGGRDFKGGWAKGKKIEIMGDRRLIVAPPSIHPKTGVRYKFLSGLSPNDIPLAPAPGWLLAKAAVSPPLDAFPVEPVPQEAPRMPQALSPGVYDRADVLDCLVARGITGVASGLGLRFAVEYANDAGWMKVHAASMVGHGGGREGDRNPSASFHPGKGLYCELYDRKVMSFFDMAVILRPSWFKDWKDAVSQLGAQYGAPLYRDSKRRREMA